MSRKVLIIDDEDDIREVETLTLETMGDFHVISAANGLDGLARAAAEQPDLILLDVMMPGLDGTATYERLKQSPATRSIPIIFMTAKVQAAERQKLAELGPLGIIAKPFDPMTLVDQLLALLDR
jgi:CheY-like chemotaxis protein